MDKHNHSKLNRLFTLAQRNVVLCSKWLVAEGYSHQLIKLYVTNGWLQKIGNGAYIRVGEFIQWPGAIYALQLQLRTPVHVGGLSALELHGLAQYITPDNKNAQIKLYNTTSEKKKLPAWFKIAFPKVDYYQYHLFDQEIGLETKMVNGIPVVISTPERAILELISLVPHSFNFKHANELVENMRLARPELMQKMLEHCMSIKVKRVLIYLADVNQLPFFEYLNTKEIDLGKGKRRIGSGGNYVAKYQLSVPKLDDQINLDEI